MSKPSIYLISPKSHNPSLSPYTGEMFTYFDLAPATFMGQAAVTTVAAMFSPEFEVEICEERVTPVNLEHPAEFVGITGMITQVSRMKELAQEFRRRGKTVLIGGPHASLAPEDFRGHCDILVCGEAEEIIDDIIADLKMGTWQNEYHGSRPDLKASPVPRWDLYPNDRSMAATLQTSRGCPFDCEFCDVIQYLGRKQRHKEPDQVVQELDTLYAHGYRHIFLADDNFTVYRARAKELLHRLIDWNSSRTEGHVLFSTQVSIDAVRDAEILELCGRAGLNTVFVGIETPNEESLAETGKRQNLKVDLIEECNKFLEYGISVWAGMIVGFDSDPRSIFEMQYNFAQASPVPIFTVSALVAPAATPLYDRMKNSGRLIEGEEAVAAVPGQTNIRMINFTSQEFLHGMRWLANRIYHPRAFGQRIINLIDALGPELGSVTAESSALAPRREINEEVGFMLEQIPNLGHEEKMMWDRVWKAVEDKPHSAQHVTSSLITYLQYRSVYDMVGFWDPTLARYDSPWKCSGGAAA